MKLRPCKRCHRYVETDVAKLATRRTRRQVTSAKRCDLRFTSECRLSVDVDNLNNFFLTCQPEKDFCDNEGNLKGFVYSLLPLIKPHTWWKAELCVSGTPSLRKQLPSHISSGESGCQQLQSLFNKASIPARLRIMLKSKEQEEIIQSFFEFDHNKRHLIKTCDGFSHREQLSFER